MLATSKNISGLLNLLLLSMLKKFGDDAIARFCCRISQSQRQQLKKKKKKNQIHYIDVKYLSVYKKTRQKDKMKRQDKKTRTIKKKR